MLHLALSLYVRYRSEHILGSDDDVGYDPGLGKSENIMRTVGLIIVEQWTVNEVLTMIVGSRRIPLQLLLAPETAFRHIFTLARAGPGRVVNWPHPTSGCVT